MHSFFALAVTTCYLKDVRHSRAPCVLYTGKDVYELIHRLPTVREGPNEEGTDDEEHCPSTVDRDPRLGELCSKIDSYTALLGADGEEERRAGPKEEEDATAEAEAEAEGAGPSPFDGLMTSRRPAGGAAKAKRSPRRKKRALANARSRRAKFDLLYLEWSSAPAAVGTRVADVAPPADPPADSADAPDPAGPPSGPGERGSIFRARADGNSDDGAPSDDDLALLAAMSSGPIQGQPSLDPSTIAGRSRSFESLSSIVVDDGTPPSPWCPSRIAEEVPGEDEEDGGGGFGATPAGPPPPPASASHHPSSASSAQRPIVSKLLFENMELIHQLAAAQSELEAATRKLRRVEMERAMALDGDEDGDCGEI